MGRVGSVDEGEVKGRLTFGLLEAPFDDVVLLHSQRQQIVKSNGLGRISLLRTRVLLLPGLLGFGQLWVSVLVVGGLLDAGLGILAGPPGLKLGLHIPDRLV